MHPKHPIIPAFLGACMVIAVLVLSGCGASRTYYANPESPGKGAKCAILFAGPAFRIDAIALAGQPAAATLTDATWGDGDNTKIIELPPGRWTIRFRFRQRIQTGVGYRIFYSEGCTIDWSAPADRVGCMEVQVAGQDSVQVRIQDKDDVPLKAEEAQGLTVCAIGRNGTSTVAVATITAEAKGPAGLSVRSIRQYVDRHRAELVGGR